MPPTSFLRQRSDALDIQKVGGSPRSFIALSMVGFMGLPMRSGLIAASVRVQVIFGDYWYVLASWRAAIMGA